MDARKLTPDFTAAPQIAPEEMARVAAMGFTTVINNRPDHENPPELQSAVMRAAALEAGLDYVDIPAETRSMSVETVAQQAAAIDASTGPVLAYCASGTRSTILWALAMAGRMPTDEIIAAAARAGYQIEGLRAQIDAAAARG